MNLFNFIIWDASPEIFHFGSFPIRWYGLLFATGFLVASVKAKDLFIKENRPAEDVDVIILCIIIATGIGARLGHVIFYELSYYIKHPLEAILPVTFYPHFKIVGYRGLASHGAAIAIPIALYLYTNFKFNIGLFPPRWQVKKQPRRGGQRFLWLIDRAVIFVALAGSLIRMGNFMNSEIIGKPTNSQYGIVFAREVTDYFRQSYPQIDEITVTKSESNAQPTDHPHLNLNLRFKKNLNQEAAIKNYLEKHIQPLLARSETIKEHMFVPADKPLNYQLTKNKKGQYVAHIDVLGKPRHPSQLYESLTTFLLFCFLLYRWSKKKQYLKDGALTGTFFIILFSLRFIQEFFKENQVDFENTLPLNMGQWLSIPFILLGIILLLYARSDKSATG